MGKRFYSKKFTDSDGQKWDSETEYNYYQYILKNKDKLGIRNIQRQVKYIIQNKFRDKNNKAVREITLTVDFVLVLITGDIAVVDCKGCKETIEETFKIKWKMMKLKYPEYDYKVVVWDKKAKEFIEI